MLTQRLFKLNKRNIARSLDKKNLVAGLGHRTRGLEKQFFLKTQRSFTTVEESGEGEKIVYDKDGKKIIKDKKNNVVRIKEDDKHVEIIGGNVEIRGKRSSEYHRSSTRYNHTTPELLAALDSAAYELMPHKKPEGVMDKIAYWIIQKLRQITDVYFKDDLLKRAMMLETVAAVPGMVAGMSHHLRSLRRLESDNWIKTLLDEAENERMHLMTFMTLIKPGIAERLLIMSVQGVFFTCYLTAFIFFPKTCHRLVGYLEEEAVKTYTNFLKLIDEGKIENVPAPDIAIEYWNMPKDATLRDVVLVVRADEMDHRDVNHTMSDYIGKLRKKEIVYDEINIDHKDLYSMEIAHSGQKDGAKPKESVDDLIKKSQIGVEH